MISGFIFDLDGTLFDTERMLAKYWGIAGKYYGFDIKPEHITSIRSTAPETAEKILKSYFGEEFNYKKVRDLRRDLMNKDIMANGIPKKKGAEEILKFAKENNIKTAIATATDEVRTKWYLENAGFTSYIDTVITTASSPRPKPYPDIYILAAGRLNVRCHEAAAFEDSENGILSACAAGCDTFFIPDMTGATEKMMNCSYRQYDSLLDAIPVLEKEIK